MRADLRRGRAADLHLRGQDRTQRAHDSASSARRRSARSCTRKAQEIASRGLPGPRAATTAPAWTCAWTARDSSTSSRSTACPASASTAPTWSARPGGPGLRWRWSTDWSRSPAPATSAPPKPPTVWTPTKADTGARRSFCFVTQRRDGDGAPAARLDGDRRAARSTRSVDPAGGQARRQRLFEELGMKPVGAADRRARRAWTWETTAGFDGRDAARRPPRRPVERRPRPSAFRREPGVAPRRGDRNLARRRWSCWSSPCGRCAACGSLRQAARSACSSTPTRAAMPATAPRSSAPPPARAKRGVLSCGRATWADDGHHPSVVGSERTASARKASRLRPGQGRPETRCPALGHGTRSKASRP